MYAIGRMQRGVCDTPVRIRGDNCRDESHSPNIVFAQYNAFAPKLMAKLMIYHKMFHTRV